MQRLAAKGAQTSSALPQGEFPWPAALPNIIIMKLHVRRSPCRDASSVLQSSLMPDDKHAESCSNYVTRIPCSWTADKKNYKEFLKRHYKNSRHKNSFL